MRSLLLSFIVWLQVFSAGLNAETLTSSNFDFIEDSALAVELTTYLNHFEQLSDTHKSQLAEALVLKIFALYPRPSYELTLKALKDHFQKKPVAIEYLARFLHTTWLARYGNLSVDPAELALTSDLQDIGLMGLVLAGAASWKQPGQWARHARLVRYLFIPAGATSPLLAGESAAASTPTAPMIYFDFAVPSEQQSELEYQAYEELLTDFAGLGVASGLTHILMSAQNTAGALTRTTMVGSRFYKPLLLMAALTYGVSGLTGMIANEMRFHDLYQNWERRRLSIEDAKLNGRDISFAEVDSFLQASRQMSFFMFYPILQMQIQEEGELNQHTADLQQFASERTADLEAVVEILKHQPEGGFLYDNPFYLQASTFVQSLASQSFDEVQIEVLHSATPPRNNDEYQLALTQALQRKIVSLETHIGTLPAITQAEMEKKHASVYEHLRNRIRHELWIQNNTRCQYEFEKYELLLRREAGREFSQHRWWEFMALGSMQNLAPQFQTQLDRQMKSPQLIQNQATQDSLQIDVTTEKNQLYRKWQTDWKSGQLCRHSPLFLSQTYEYLNHIDQPLAQQAAHQNLELLVAQKLLIQSLLY